MSKKTLVKPEPEQARNGLWQVRQVILYDDGDPRGKQTTYLWKHDMEFHLTLIGDDRPKPFPVDRENPRTWAGHWRSRDEAEVAIQAAKGGEHEPWVQTNRLDYIYIRRRTKQECSKRPLTQFLWKDMTWRVSCYPIGWGAQEILWTSTEDSPAFFCTWDEATKFLEAHHDRIQSNTG